MVTKDNPLNSLEQNEWDALILSIVSPFFCFCSYSDTLITVEDLQQEAWISLLIAAEKYDPTKAKFITYAYHYISGHIKRYISNRLKNKPYQIDIDSADVNEGEYIDDSTELKDVMSIILEKISDEKHANILIEHYIKNKSIRQIAKEHGVSHEMISVRIKKLLELLQIRLKHENA